jgi:GTP-binding protein Era
MNNKSYKSGFITIIGNPSVGKSTLINALIGEKIAITSNKPQTTRKSIKGIITTDEYQIIFIDTPGVNKTKNKLGKLMNKNIDDSICDADIVITVLDATKLNDNEMLLGKLQKVKVPSILLLNKIDKIKDKSKILNIIEEYRKLYNFDEIIPVSAVTKEGLERLIEEVTKRLPYGPCFFPEDIITDSSEKTIVEEIIREKALELLEDEVPHGIAVNIEKMKKRTGKEITDITATIYCEKESHKGIIIGKGGKMLKEIGSCARADIEKFIKMKVFLEIWVKVRNDWRNNETELKRLKFSE